MALIKVGSRGTATKAAQQKLKDLGYSLDADGIFGKGSKAAVIQFQQDNDLPADGIIGPNTLKVMDARLAEKGDLDTVTTEKIAGEKAVWIESEIDEAIKKPNFDQFFPTLLKHEGGFVDNPNDPGGATNKGITLRTFQNFADHLLGIEPSLKNLEALTDDQAKAIYKAQYWDKIRADQFPSYNLAVFTFDFYVNAGGNGVKVLQQTLKDLGQNVDVDGVIGSGTVKSVCSVDIQALYKGYKEGRRAYYKGLAEKNPKFNTFLKGWLARVDSFPDHA